MTPKYSADGPSGVSKHKKAVIGPIENYAS